MCHKTKNKERGIARFQDAIHSIEKAPLESKLIHFAYKIQGKAWWKMTKHKSPHLNS